MKQINLSGIGPVLFKQSHRAKYIRISVKSSLDITVTVPLGTSLNKAKAFVAIKRDWIKKHQSELRNAEKSYNSRMIDRKKAKSTIQKRLHELSSKHNLPYNSVMIRNQKTRWGSCSYKNNISLNIKLAMLPDELADYVVLHELVHTKIKNHSKNFWNKLDSIVVNAKKKNIQLKQYHFLLSINECSSDLQS